MFNKLTIYFLSCSTYIYWICFFLPNCVIRAVGSLNQCQMPPVLSQLSNLLTPAGPAHGDRGASLHQLRNAGLPLRTDHQSGSEYIKSIFQHLRLEQPRRARLQVRLPWILSSAVNIGRLDIFRTSGQNIVCTGLQQHF